MTLENRISAFTKLGGFLSQFSKNSIEKKEDIQFNDLFFDIFKTQMKFNNYLNNAVHKVIVETNKKAGNTQSEEEFVKKNFGM